MWISELNTKELTDPAYVAFDDGEDTYKTEFNECVENAANAAVAAADLTENEVAFTSGDAASPTAWSSVPVLASGSTLATLFNRISTMIKNVRWLYSKLGTTDISSIGNGTVTGALSTLNGNTNATVINSLTSSHGTFDDVYSSIVYNKYMCVFQARFTATSSISAYTTFFQLPNSLAPKMNITTPMYVNGSLLGTMRIQNNGYIRPELAMASGTTYEFCCVFLR